jgi:cytochrome c biogenesis protein CcmG, thiol:disulfide interchange protein DsbE
MLARAPEVTGMSRFSRAVPFGAVIVLTALGGIWLTFQNEPVASSAPGGDQSSPPPAETVADAVPPTPTSEPAGPGRPLIGSQAPDLTLETLEGETVTLTDLNGQVVLINFWATWCLPCRDEMPAIQKVYDQYRDHGFAVLGVNFLETNGEVQAFVQELDLTFPILMDRDGEVTLRYAVIGLPTSFFVDRSGVIQNVTIGGPMTDAFVESQVVPLLSGQQQVPDVVD